MHKTKENTSQQGNTSSNAQQINIHTAHHAQSKYRCINKHNFVTSLPPQNVRQGYWDVKMSDKSKGSLDSPSALPLFQALRC